MSAQPYAPPPESNSNRHHPLLKRTASRAELDQRSSHAQDEFVHSEPPPPLPSEHAANKSNPDPAHTHDQPAHEDVVFVKPEYLTPHLPPQLLPSQSIPPSPPPVLARSNSSGSAGAGVSPRSPDSESRLSYPTRPRSIIHPTPSHQTQRDLSTLSHSNSLKKRRVTITDEKSFMKPRNGAHVSVSSSNQSSSSPDTRIHGRNSISKHTSESGVEPVSPLVIGFHQPNDASAMQQVANTIKLREEQKRLIEQRRNSFAGQSSLNSFSFSSNHAHSGQPAPSSQSSRCSPGTARPNGARTSISKPVPPSVNNCGSNGIMKLLSHQSLITSPSSNQQQSQRSHPPPPPVVNLPPIDEAATRKRNSVSNHSSHRPPPPLQSAPNKPNQPPHPKPTSNPNMLDVDAPSSHQPSGQDSAIASRRGEVVREKVKNLALAPQAFRPHLLVQPSVKSAPIRSGFLQATAPNGEVVKTPLIARTNIAGGAPGNNTSQATDGHGALAPNFSTNSSNLHHQPSRLSHSSGSGPATAHPNLAATDTYATKGLERRMTMHSGALMQVPTLSHALINSNPTLAQAQPSPSRGRPIAKTANSGSTMTHSVPLMPGPKTAIPSFANLNHHQQQDMLNGSRNFAANGNHSHGPSAQFQFHPPQQQRLSPDHLHLPPSARLRPSIGSANAAGLTPGIPPKHMFLQLFDTFYDSLSDSKILQSNLEDQIRRSAQLLTLLQQSSTVFEKMLDDRMAGIQKEFTRDLQILENRIERLEARAAESDPIVENSEDDCSTELKNPDLLAAVTRSPQAHLPQNESNDRPPSRTSVLGGGSSGFREDRTIIQRLEKLERDIPKSNESLGNYASGRGGFNNAEQLTKPLLAASADPVASNDSVP